MGTCELSFDRFIKAVDDLSEATGEEIIIQTGYSRYRPRFSEYFDFCDSEKMILMIKNANIVIAHAGCGIIGDCIKNNKRLILIPREHRYKESVDKQNELAEYVAKTTEKIIFIRDVSKLVEAVSKIRNMQPEYLFETKIPELVRDFIYEKFGVTREY